MDLKYLNCLQCLAGYHWECIDLDADGSICCCPDSPLQGVTRGGPTKSDDEVTDPKSTGRKRAAVLYPITEGMICEWAGLKFACGGRFPIVGCTGRPATHRHHGPDKNTLNNDSGNVHRICVYCHNRWHTLNDPVYEDFFGTEDWKPHDPETKATVEEQLNNEIEWTKRKVKATDDHG
jgi:hypothetical protein